MKHLLSLTAGILIGGAAVSGWLALAMRSDVPTPTLRPAVAMTVTLHPSVGIEGIDCVPVEIPPEAMDLAFRLLTPDSQFRGGVHDFGNPIVAEAVVKHSDGTQTSVVVRDFGHNPAVVSLDGRTYFTARDDPDVLAGAHQLVRLARESAFKVRSERRPKP